MKGTTLMIRRAAIKLIAAIILAPQLLAPQLLALKMRIVKIGTVTDAGLVTGWTFDGPGIGLDYRAAPPLLGGYTVDELRTIADPDLIG